MKVVYGHTDSIYLQIPDVDTAQKVCSHLNDRVRLNYPNLLNLENHPVTLEFEKYYKALGVGCTKNRNAGFISWKDGHWLAEPEFVVTGYSMKRIASTPLAKETQEIILRMWAGEKTEREIVAYLKTRYNDALHGRLSMDEIIARGRVRGDRLKVKLSCNHVRLMTDLMRNEGYCGKVDEDGKVCYGGDPTTLEGKGLSVKDGIKGVCYYNYINEDNPIIDSFLFIKIRPGHRTFVHPSHGKTTVANYISVHEKSELSEYEPDWIFYAESIVKKAKPIFEAMNWDITQIQKDSKQQVLDDW